MKVAGVRACEDCGALYLVRLNDGTCRGCSGRVMPADADGYTHPEYPAPMPKKQSWWRRWFGGVPVQS